MELNNQNGVILYDYLAYMGGAERLTLDFVHTLWHAELCVGFRIKSAIMDDMIKGITCHEITGPSNNVAFRTLKLLRAFKKKTTFIERYEWALYSGILSPIAVHNHPSGRNCLYCHTIPRFVYDLKDYYLKRVPIWQSPLLKALIAYVRPRYEASLSKMDLIIVNSENVRKRLKKYLDLDAKIVHPPCKTNHYSWEKHDGYYLSNARLENFKRIELILKAFLKMPQKKLIITSGGSEFERLKKMAQGADNIVFTGWVSEKKLRRLISQAIATIYIPIDEDFGMSPVESMAAGKPVIGVAEGGLLETVIHGESGILIPPNPRIDHLIDAVQKMSPKKALEMRESCEKRATAFDQRIFEDELRDLIRGVLEK